MVKGTSRMRASVCASSVLPRAGRADQQDVRLRQFDVVVLGRVVQPLVVVVHRDRQDALGVVLADDVIVQHLADFRGVGTPSAALDQRADLFSSRMMSMHSSTHSSQMNTVGPAISLRTSCWLLPQNEQ
jgi:hypothetical protein